MTVHHAFSSAKSDSGDPTLVNPSNWNAAHVIDAGTIAYAMMQNESAGTLLGNNTGAAAAPAEITPSQLFDMISSTNGVLLTRTSGVWTAAANVSVDSGDLKLAFNNAPATPAAGFVKPFGAQLALRDMLGVQTAAAAPPYLAQPLIGQKSIGRWSAIPGGNSFSADGLTAPTATGTPTSRNPANTSFAASLRRIGLVSATTAASVSGIRYSSAGFLWRGNVANAGGFLYVARFFVSDASLVTTANMFVGVEASIAAPTDVAPSTLANLIGIGCDNGDTNLQLYAAGSAAQARTSLGASFPVNTTGIDVYELALYCAPNSAQITYQVTRLNTGAVATGTITAAANLPSSTTLMTPQIWRSNGGTAAAVGIDVTGVYTEIEY